MSGHYQVEKNLETIYTFLHFEYLLTKTPLYYAI